MSIGAMTAYSAFVILLTVLIVIQYQFVKGEAGSDESAMGNLTATIFIMALTILLTAMFTKMTI